MRETTECKGVFVGEKNFSSVFISFSRVISRKEVRLIGLRSFGSQYKGLPALGMKTTFELN